jgi:hypothetical protein
MEIRAHGLTLFIALTASLACFQAESPQNALQSQPTTSIQGLWPQKPALASFHYSRGSVGTVQQKDFSPGPKPAKPNQARARARGADTGLFSNPLSRVIFGVNQSPERIPSSHTPPPGCVPMAPPGE